MVQLLWRNDSAIYQAVHTQAGFHILAYVRVQTHGIHLLNSLLFMHFVMQTHGLRLALVLGMVGTQRNVSCYKMHEQFGFLIDYTNTVKFTFPLKLDLISRSRYLP